MNSLLGRGLLGGGGGSLTVMIISGILGLILGIVLLVIFLPARNRGKFHGFLGWLYDFLNFHKYWITWLLKLLNIIVAVVCLLGGFITLFLEPLTGLFMMLGYAVYRMLLELIMVTLNIRDNVSEIADKISRMGLPGSALPAETTTPAIKTCPQCGTPAKPGTHFCMKCGSPV
jgi:hypothetical protein